MDKQTYLEQLRFHLAGRMPVNEVERVVQYYSDQFDTAQTGDTAMAQDLGDPQELAKDLIDDYLNLKTEYDRRNQKPPKKNRHTWWPFVVIAALGIGAFGSISGNFFIGRHEITPQREITESTAIEISEAAISSENPEHYVSDFSRTISNGDSYSVELPFISDFNCYVDSANVQFAVGDSYSVEVVHADGAPDITLDHYNGSLTISSSSNYFVFGFNFADKASQILVTVPDGGALDSLYLENDWGSVDISGQTIHGSLIIDSDAGSVSITDTVADSMNFDLDAGDLQLQNIQSNQLYADCDLGKITGTGVTTGGMTLNCDVGEINLDGAFHGDTYIDSDIGAVTLSTSLAESDYSINISADIGSVRINGQSQRSNNANWGNGRHSIDIDSDIGSVDLNFAS